MKWKMNLSKVGNWKKTRTILALLFVLVISLLFIWSVIEDSRLKENQMFLQGFSIGIHYSIQFKSLNPGDETFNVTLSVNAGMLPFEIDPKKIYYGPLVYDDLSFPYAIGIPIISQKLVAQLGPFKTVTPTPKEISIRAVGNPEIYPFDKYFIMGVVKCPAYFIEGKTKKYFETRDHGESLGIINSINGLFIRRPTKKELNQIRASLNVAKRPISPVDDKDLEEINNRKDTFALMIVRPYYLQFMTVVLGLFALAVAFYIGFVQPLKDKAISMPGFVIAVWGIRSILLSDTKIFLAYFDYVALSLYLILFVGITYRLISGEKKQGH